MHAGAQPSITEKRQAARRPARLTVSAVHRTLGELSLVMADISATGFLICARSGIEPGDQILLEIPAFGRITALCIWIRGQKAGFLFEKTIAKADFEYLIERMSSDPAPGAKACQSNGRVRTSDRKRALAFAELCTPEGWEKVRVKDFSGSGARVVSTRSIPLGTDVIFKRAATFRAGRVAWSRDNEAGLQFYRKD